MRDPQCRCPECACTQYAEPGQDLCYDCEQGVHEDDR